MSMYQDKAKRATYHSSAYGICVTHVVKVLQHQGYPLTCCLLYVRALMVDLNLHSSEMWLQNEVWNPVMKAMVVPNQNPFPSGPPVKGLHLNEMQN